MRAFRNAIRHRARTDRIRAATRRRSRAGARERAHATRPSRLRAFTRAFVRRRSPRSRIDARDAAVDRLAERRDARVCASAGAADG
jgi:hypothetical protein